MSDAGSTGSEDLTVEEQNVTNAESDDIHRLLSNFMDSKEESLEELVGGFMYLTMDDLKQSNNRAVAAALNQTSQAPAIETAKTTNKGDSKRLSSENKMAHSDAGNISTQSKTATGKSGVTNAGGGEGEGSDDIEEEVLDDISPGQQSGACFLRQRPSLTKFDNFVATEEEEEEEEGDKDDANSDSETYKADKAESDDEDWLPASGYSASFATNPGQSTKKIDASGNSKTPTTTTTATAVKTSYTENATTAFTRNSKKTTTCTTTTTTAVVTSKTETETAASSRSSIGDVLSLHTESAVDTNKSTPAAVVLTSDPENCVDKCDSSSLGTNSETAICSERSKLDLESKTATKLEPKTATTVDTEASSNLVETENKQYQNDDNEGEDSESHLIHTDRVSVKQNKMNDRGMFENPSSASQGDDDECDERSEGCDLDLEAPAWTLNPGEVEEEEGRNAVMKVRVMDFSTKVVADATLDENAEPEKEEDKTEASSDEVVPFSLDGDFDYDNVAYTPKYTADDIRYFMSFMPDSAKS